MGSLSIWHWLIVIVVVLLLFGSRKLPDMARGLGQSMRIFKNETRAMKEENAADKADAPGPADPGYQAGSTNPTEHPKP